MLIPTRLQWFRAEVVVQNVVPRLPELLSHRQLEDVTRKYHMMAALPNIGVEQELSTS